MREIRYRSIADGLRRRIEEGEFRAGRLLPSEADLSAAYAASRITVRKALELLRDEGLVDSRQGFGWFVAADPLRQTLGRLGTIEGQLVDSGLSSERRVLDFRFRAAPARVRRELGATTVLEVRRLNLADGVPFAVVTVWAPDELGRRLSKDDVERAPFYELLDVEWGSAIQTIGASVASADEASHLEIGEGSPVLRCTRLTRSADGAPVLFSEHVFPAHRTEFVVELSRTDESIAPSGLRLVE